MVVIQFNHAKPAHSDRKQSGTYWTDSQKGNIPPKIQTPPSLIWSSKILLGDLNSPGSDTSPAP